MNEVAAQGMVQGKSTGPGAKERRAAAIVVLVVTGGEGLLVAIQTRLGLAWALPVAAGTAIAAWLIVGILYWWVLTKVPYFAPIGRTVRWLALMWGALVAVLLASAVENQLGLDTMTKSATTQGMAIAVTAGVVEEGVKALGILVLFLFVQRPRTLVEGLVIGGTVGLGFEVSEDLAYSLGDAWAAGSDGPAGIVLTMVSRAATSVVSHWAFSLIAGVGLAYVFCARWVGPARRAAVLIGCIALAMVLHAGWDAPPLGQSQRTQGITVGLKEVVVIVAIVVAVLLFMRWARNREGEYYATYLVRDGDEPLPAAQLHALPHGKTRRHARKTAAAEASTHSERRRLRASVRSMHRAAARLAVAIAQGDEASAAANRQTLRTCLASRTATSTEVRSP